MRYESRTMEDAEVTTYKELEVLANDRETQRAFVVNEICRKPIFGFKNEKLEKLN